MTKDEMDELIMEEQRLEVLEYKATQLEELNRSQCPLHLECRKTIGCPYHQERCTYPLIGKVESPATRGK